MAIADDVLDVIRRLKLGGKMDEAVDPAAMKYLGDLGQQERAWYARFGFEPDAVNPPDVGVVGRAARSMDQGAPMPPDMGLESQMFDPLYKATGAYDNLRKGRTPNLRNSGGDLARIAGDNIRRADDAARQSQKTAKLQDDLLKIGVAGGVAGVAGGVGMMAMPDTAPGAVAKGPSKPAPKEDDLLTSGNPADLVEETRPAPKVPTQDDVQPQVAKAPTDYSAQARVLINRLNDMRRAAGGEVPQAKEMEAEIERLLAMGNEQRREPDFQPEDDASSRFKQAQELINRLNAMYRDGLSPNSPQAQQIMAQVRKLQAEGDALRNSRTAAPMPSAPVRRSGGMGRAKLPSATGTTRTLGRPDYTLPRRSSPSDT
jgi:hypothetical protein